MPYPIDKYRDKAKNETFPNLLANFSTWTNSWQIGNVFDTLSDYLLRVPDAEKSPGAVAEIALDRWSKAAGSLCWYDDYGWWGIASEKAFHNEYRDIFKGHAAAFRNIATQCWQIMHTGKPGAYSYRGGPNVWANRENGSATGYFTSREHWAVPRFDGGVWQWEMFKDRRETGECSPSNPADPTSSTVAAQGGPYQCTVMNSLYLVLALRLTRHGIIGANQAVANEIGFLKSWFDLDREPGQQGQEGLLMRFPSSPFVLVRERVGSYAHQSETNSYPRVLGYKPDAAWCGDQGLMLGALADYKILEDPTPISIAGGVFRHLVDSGQVVQPTLNLDIDPDDYGCGSGVFWRYLLWGFHQDTTLRQQVLEWINRDRDNNPVYRSAEYAYANGGPGNTLFAEFNVLATLTAAIDILQAADGLE